MKRIATLLSVLVMGAVLALPQRASADDQTIATAGAGGVYPPGTNFTGVDVKALQLAFGAEVNPDGSGLGNLTAVLLGTSALGLEQNIVIKAEVTGGTRNAVNVAVLTGTATIDLGDGTPAVGGVPFTATLTSADLNLGVVGLALTGFSALPDATLNAGSLAIRTVPIE